jgi:hypothetical protein
MRNIRAIPLIALLALVTLTPLAASLYCNARKRAAPQTLDDAVRIAEAQGLYWQGDAKHGPPSTRIVVAERPMSWERASWTYLDPRNARLVGNAAVYYDPQRTFARDNYLPGRSACWGALFVVGDPRVIEQLTGELPNDVGE